MRLVIASLLAALSAVQSPSVAAEGGVGLRSSIMPDGEAAPATAEASAVLLQLSPASTLTFTTSAAVAQDGWIDRSDEGATAFTARLRAGYQATPSLRPFVEAAVTHRQSDRTSDGDGLRASTEYAWRAGVAFDHLVSGEVAVGYAEAGFGDPTLAVFGALTVDGSLAWAPTTLTMVTLTGATSFAPGDVRPSSGAVFYDGSVDLAYAWQRDFDLIGTAGVRQAYHQGSDLIDTRYRAGLSATWKMNETYRLTAGYRHEWQDSTDPSRAYESDAVRVELRMQR